MPGQLGTLAVTAGDRFRLIEHTADMGIEARASSRAAVTEAMARGLAAMIFGRSRAAARCRADIVLRADDPVELLVGCLNEIVYWSEKESMVPAALSVEAFDDKELSATITGEPYDPARHGVEHQVKSVTYHQACLEETAGEWYARVYVDL